MKTFFTILGISAVQILTSPLAVAQGYSGYYGQDPGFILGSGHSAGADTFSGASQSGLATTNSGNSPSTFIVGGRVLSHDKLTKLLGYLPSSVPLKIGVTNNNSALAPLVIELPAGTRSLTLEVGGSAYTFQKFNESFHQLDGGAVTGLGVTEFDDGPRLAIPVSLAPTGTATNLELSTDTPKCQCDDTSCKKTGTTPSNESPAESPSASGLSASFPLGLDCCNSQQVPGAGVWAPSNLANAISLNSIVSLPNQEMLDSSDMDDVIGYGFELQGGIWKVYSGRQWRTDGSLVFAKKTDTELTITTYLNPGNTPCSSCLYDLNDVDQEGGAPYELSQIKITQGFGEVFFESSFNGAVVQSYRITETVNPDTPAPGQTETVMVTEDLLSHLKTVRTDVKTLSSGAITSISQKYFSAPGLNNILLSSTERRHEMKLDWCRLVHRDNGLGDTATYHAFDANGHSALRLNGDQSWLVRLNQHVDLPGDAYDIKIRPFLNSAHPPLQSNLESHQFGADLVTFWLDDVRYTIAQGEELGGQAVSLTFGNHNGQPTVQESTTRADKANRIPITSSRTYHTFGASQRRLRGKTISTQSETGLVTSYDHDFGSWDANQAVWTSLPAGSDLRTIMSQSHNDYANEPHDYFQSAIDYYDLLDRPIRHEDQVKLRTGGTETYSVTTHEYLGAHAPYGLISTEVKKDGRVIHSEMPSSSYTTTTIDRTGTRSITVKDPAGRLVSQETFYDHLPGRSRQKVTYSYQGLTTQMTHTNGSAISLSSRTVDLLGRPVSTTGQDQKTHTYTYPDLLTSETRFLGTVISRQSRYRDGSAWQTHGADPENGNALVLLSSRTVAPSGGWGHLVTTTSRYGQSDSTTTTNQLGDPVFMTTPSGTGAGNIITTYEYNTLNQLRSVTSSAPNTKSSRYTYDLLGRRVDSGQDTNNDSTLVLGQDRMSRTRTFFTKDQGIWWQQTNTKVQADANDPIRITAKFSRIQLPAMTAPETLISQTRTESLVGTVTSFTTLRVNAGGYPQGVTTTTVDSPNSNLDAVSISAHGMPTSATSHLSAVAETWAYSEQATGITTTHTNAKGGVTRTVTNTIGQVIAVQNPVNLRSLYKYGTNTAHPSIGQLISSTNGENETITYDYDLLGRKTFQSGATYPVAYGYDPIGRMTTMATYRDEAAGTPSVTAWLYNPHSGLLASKRYNYTSPGSKGNDYQYDDLGRLKKHQLARTLPNTTTRLEKNYSYNANGDLSGVSYNDNKTTAYQFQDYDLFGSPRNIEHQDEADELAITYNHQTGKVESEKYLGGLLNGLRIDRAYGTSIHSATVGQETSMIVWGGATRLHGRTNWYGQDGRLSGHFGWDYDDNGYYRYDTLRRLYLNSYSENSQHLESSQIGKYFFGNQFLETKINRDTSYRFSSAISKSLGANPAVVTSMGYTFDRAGRRTHATREDGTTWRYQYNKRGELTNAAKLLPNQQALAGQQFGYTYDDIGNRLTASFGGGTGTEAGKLREISYHSDQLNQYTSITHSQHANVLGLLDPGTAVEVVGELAPADRQGPRFRSEVQASNTSGEWFQANVKTGTSPYQTSTDEGSRWIPAANTTPTYDHDGNLTSDDRWTYTWDAENRLTQMAPTPAALAGGHPNHILKMHYDYLSRRIQKQVLDGANNNAILSDRRFLYDGWNLVAEFQGDTQNNLTIISQHYWTNDISGTSQGAGGVGGLWMSRIKRTDNDNWEIFYPTYDGNGNILSWVDDTGNVAQRLDYDGFGNQISRNGDLPGGIEMNFGFSTKYEDQESGLLYYGYRYYDPVTGRWPSRDPIGERGGINLYGMVGNDGVSSFDRLGLEEVNDLSQSSAAYDLIDIMFVPDPQNPRPFNAKDVIGQFRLETKIDTSDCCSDGGLFGLHDPSTGEKQCAGFVLIEFKVVYTAKTEHQQNTIGQGQGISGVPQQKPEYQIIEEGNGWSEIGKLEWKGEVDKGKRKAKGSMLGAPTYFASVPCSGGSTKIRFAFSAGYGVPTEAEGFPRKMMGAIGVRGGADITVSSCGQIEKNSVFMDLKKGVFSDKLKKIK